jgi:hypothetical protein
MAHGIFEISERPLYRRFNSRGSIDQAAKDFQMAVELALAWNYIRLVEDLDLFLEERSPRGAARSSLVCFSGGLLKIIKKS